MISRQELRVKQDKVIKILEAIGKKDGDVLSGTYDAQLNPITLEDLKKFIYPELEWRVDEIINTWKRR